MEQVTLTPYRHCARIVIYVTMINLAVLFVTSGIAMFSGERVPPAQRGEQYVLTDKGTDVRVSPLLYKVVKIQEMLFLLLFVPFIIAAVSEGWSRLDSVGGSWSIRGKGTE